MDLKEIETQVQHLAESDLLKFGQWFDTLRDARLVEGEIDGAQKEEVLRRQAEYLSDPSGATAWDDGFFDRLQQRLADVRNQKG